MGGGDDVVGAGGRGGDEGFTAGRRPSPEPAPAPAPAEPSGGGALLAPVHPTRSA